MTTNLETVNDGKLLEVWQLAMATKGLSELITACESEFMRRAKTLLSSAIVYIKHTFICTVKTNKGILLDAVVIAKDPAMEFTLTVRGEKYLGNHYIVLDMLMWGDNNSFEHIASFTFNEFVQHVNDVMKAYRKGHYVS